MTSKVVSGHSPSAWSSWWSFCFCAMAAPPSSPVSPCPVSLIGTFAVMYLLNYSLDNLSLMALTISTGFVVDDAIVVMENISRYLEMGMKPRRCAQGRAKKSALPCSP